jgi:hypothetical protein
MNQAAAQTTLAPKSDEPTVLIPIEQQIQQRAYELYEQRGKDRGSRLGRLASGRVRDKGQAGERSNGIEASSVKNRKTTVLESTANQGMLKRSGSVKFSRSDVGANDVYKSRADSMACWAS